MKATCIYFSLIIISVLGFISCGDKDEPSIHAPNSKSDNEITNEWIYDKMKRVYLWNEELPNTPNYTHSPESFFKSILYNPGSIDGDRFSWIEKDQSKSKSLYAEANLGFDYIPNSYFASVDAKNSSIGLFVISVSDGAEAKAKGVKRGQVIYEVNGTPVTYDNYKTILTNSTNLTLGIYNKVGQKETLKPFTAYAEESSPVFLSKIITTNNGTKVGYLIYNAFERNADNKDNNYEYDIELIESIRAMGNIDEFVLDLRYNLGGYLTSAMDLASALVPNRNTKNIFVKETYNKYYTDSLTTKYGTDALNEYFQDKVLGTQIDIQKLNLKRLYVLATGYSASASELVIHGLRPYMTVNHIGETTVGKDKASQTIKSDDKRILWQLQPIISRIADKHGVGNYINGLSPNKSDYMISELDEGYQMVSAYYQDDNGNEIKTQLPLLSDWKGGFGELGDPTEPLLAKALGDIDPTMRIKTTKSSTYHEWLPKKVPFIKSDKEKRAITIIDK